MKLLGCLSAVFYLLLKLFPLYFGLIGIFTIFRRKRIPKAAPATRFAVLAAARNEEAVIGDLVRSALHQDYPPELVDVYIIPNNCTDRTAEVAREAGAKIIYCPEPVRCKGDALRQAFAQLLPRHYDAFVVLDADNTLAEDYLARMNDAFVAGAKVCKSRTMAANPKAAPTAGCYGIYFTAFDWGWNRPRDWLGLSAKLIGTGFAVRSEVLETMGGWNTVTIAEDAEFAAMLAQAGQRVQWVPDAINYDEEPLDFLTSLKQRRRWCSGVMQAASARLKHLWSGKEGNPFLRLDMTMFLLLPFTQAINGLLLPFTILAVLLSPDPLLWMAFGGGMVLSFAGGFLLGCILSILGGYGLKGMWKAALLYPVFTAFWAPLHVVALFRRKCAWKPMVHRGTGRQLTTLQRAA